MKILIATGLYPPEIGGPATYSKILNDELPKHGLEVSVLPFSTVRHLPKIIRHVTYFGKVLLQGRGVDIIFAQDPVSVGFPAMVAAKILRKKFLLRLGGDYAWEQAVQRYHVTDTLDEFSKKGSYLPPIKLLRRIQKNVASQAEKVIVPSNYLKVVVENWGISQGKIKVIYNAFSVDVGTEDKELLRKKLNVVGTHIISAGRLVPWKGFASIIALMPELLKAVPRVKLLIAGDGPELENLRQMVRNHKLENSVVFLGNLSKKQLTDYIKASDFFVLNTGYEGFSHQLLEVMSVGIPIITTSVGGNKELVVNGESGILVEYNNQREIVEAIEKLVTDDVLRKKLTQNAMKKVEQFTKEKMIRETVKELSI